MTISEIVNFIVVSYLIMIGIRFLARIFFTIEVTTQKVDTKEIVKNIVLEATVEKHGNMFYVFDSESDRFLGQGRTYKEVNDHVLENLKQISNKPMVHLSGDDQILKMLNATKL